MSVFYNDNEPFVCDWLENLIAKGHLPDGTVDRRRIEEVHPADIAGFLQCHFFAGIGGWPLALSLAGWPPGSPVWTGSCPCQPISSAGKRRGHLDARHLWPEWFRLIRQCRPPVVFGEQVASSDGLEWLDGVFTDLEDEGYACGAADLCAAGVGALHRRQRVWWVADANCVRPQGKRMAEKAAWTWEQLEGLVQTSLRTSVPSRSRRSMVDGVPNRVGRLRAYGNAIVPQVAAAFIRAYMES
jgi:DNA (cytosine-5)-methyltransferase 1